MTGIADAFGSFQPSALIFWTSQQVTDGFTLTPGSPDGANLTINVTSPVNGSRGWSSTKPKLSNVRAAPNFVWAFQSWWDAISSGNNNADWLFGGVAPGEFTIRWVVVDTFRPAKIWYLAFGGADFDMSVGSLVQTAPGSQTVTGLPFAPSGIMTMTLVSVTQPAGSPLFADNLPALGVATEEFQGASCCSLWDTNFPLQWMRYQLATRSILMRSGPTAKYRSEGLISAFNPDGFTAQWTEAHLPTAPNDFKNPGIYYAAFGGAIPVQAGATLQPTSPGIVSIDLGGRPGAILFWTHNAAANLGPIFGQNTFTFGGADAQGNQSSIYMGVTGDSGGGPRGQFSTRAITCATPPVSGSAATLTGAATAAMTATGVDLDWTVCDGTSREILWMAFGVVAEPPPPPPPPENICQIGHGYCEPTLGAPRIGV